MSALALLLAQISVAAYACPKLSVISGESTITMAQSADVPCDDMDMQQPSVCYEHCKDQVGLDRIQLPSVPPATLLASNLVVPLLGPHRATAATNWVAHDLTRVTRPPPSVLFCVFRI